MSDPDAKELDPFRKIQCEADHCENMVTENETVVCEVCGKKFCPACAEDMVKCENCKENVCENCMTWDTEHNHFFCGEECEDEWLESGKEI